MHVRKTGCNCGSTVMPPVAAVTWNDKLAKAAYDHSVEMKANDYFSHTGLMVPVPVSELRQQVIHGKRMEKILPKVMHRNKRLLMAG